MPQCASHAGAASRQRLARCSTQHATQSATDLDTECGAQPSVERWRRWRRWRGGGGALVGWRRCDRAWLELWQASQEKLVRNICRRTVWNKLEMLGLMALAAEAIRERDCERLGRPDSGASGR